MVGGELQRSDDPAQNEIRSLHRNTVGGGTVIGIVLNTQFISYTKQVQELVCHLCSEVESKTPQEEISSDTMTRDQEMSMKFSGEERTGSTVGGAKKNSI